MLTRSVIRLLIMLLMGTTTVMAQWTPVTARIRETTEIVKGGKTIAVKEARDGVFLRSSDGSTLTHWTSARVNGQDAPSTGDLLNNSTQHTYMLNYNAKTARQSQFNLPQSLRPDLYAHASPVLGDDTVAGLPCKLIPISTKQSPTAPFQRNGQACVSETYGLMLREETNDPQPDGSVIHFLRTMYDIALNVEPDAKEFDIESSFAISKP